MKRVIKHTRTVFSGFAFLLSIGAAVWLLACLAASMIHPADFKFLSLLSLTTAFALAANVLFLLFFLLSKHKARSFVPVLALAASYKLLFSVFGINFMAPSTTAKKPGEVRVMTWNVHGLGIYERPMDKKRPEKMVSFIKQYQPDILCLVEFFTDLENGIAPHGDVFLQGLGYKEYRFSWDNTLGTKIFVGNAIFSKYPLSNFQTEDIAEYIKVMSCDIQLPENKKIRGYFFHLQSFHLAEDEKEMIEKVKGNAELAKSNMNKGRSYLSKFDKNYVLRADEADKIAKLIARSPYPVLICADLNDLPGSYTYTTVRGNLCDAFADKGLGLGRTYNLLSPTLRIDYIFFKKGPLIIKDCSTPLTELSDHNPVIATFDLQ